MNDVRARMSCLRSFSSRVRRARWMEGSSRGFRWSQTVVVGIQWKGGGGGRVGRGYVHLVGKEDFKSLISSSTSSSYWAFWTSIKVCPDRTRRARTLMPCRLSGLDWIGRRIDVNVPPHISLVPHLSLSFVGLRDALSPAICFMYVLCPACQIYQGG